ncbi:hypothetical protein BX070DRAFT_217966 [Coemansia spiralis]|nr:hypothetical protein BX070DRAFT_217966 [Coemansia spiralis]
MFVPIRTGMEVGDHQLHSVFVWNAKERVITSKQFAAIYCTAFLLSTGERAEV